MKYNILVTEVTCYGTLRCVAGWDVNGKAMIRPEPHGANVNVEASRFWDQTTAGKGKPLAVGNLVEFEGENTADPNFPYPHATEDRLVKADNSLKVVGQFSVAEMRTIVGPGVSGTLAQAFDGGLNRYGNGKAWVTPGFRGRSLGAIETDASNLTIFESISSTGKRQLRARLKEVNNTYDLSLTAEDYKGIWPATDAATLRASVQKLGKIHLRVGLARAFGDFGCLAQVNGIYGIT